MHFDAHTAPIVSVYKLCEPQHVCMIIVECVCVSRVCGHITQLQQLKETQNSTEDRDGKGEGERKRKGISETRGKMLTNCACEIERCF